MDMGAPQSGADIYRDGKKMRAAPKERTRKEYGRRLTAGGNARAPQSGAEAEPPQSGGHIGKGIWTAQQRRDIFGMGPLANRQSGYSYRNGYIWARLQGGTYIGKKIWALANSERHIGNGDADGPRNWWRMAMVKPKDTAVTVVTARNPRFRPVEMDPLGRTPICSLY